MKQYTLYNKRNGIELTTVFLTETNRVAYNRIIMDMGFMLCPSN
jgi:hypothetical protein